MHCFSISSSIAHACLSSCLLVGYGSVTMVTRRHSDAGKRTCSTVDMTTAAIDSSSQSATINSRDVTLADEADNSPVADSINTQHEIDSDMSAFCVFRLIFTGNIAYSAKSRYSSYSEGDVEFFCTDGVTFGMEECQIPSPLVQG